MTIEKTIKWDSSEESQMKVIENDRTQVLARIGALMMELEEVKKNLEAINGRQRAAVQQVLSNRGITQFESARPIPGGIVLTIPEVMNGEGNAS